MSEPKRYTQNIKCVEPSYLAQNIQSGMVECSIGEWVLHSDYARLKAEVERLTKIIESSQYYFMSIKLTAENERLRKAGDAMANVVMIEDYIEAAKAWNNAKEGKQS